MIKSYKNVFLLFTLFLAAVQSKAQEQLIPTVSKDYFRNPLDLPLLLAGNFGEIRSNHFHSGLDIKTNQREGYPVYAVADGYVARLRVQIGGFGNAIYIKHPNGLTSVYAHLQKFNPRMADMMKGIQYKNKAFDQDVILTPIEIPIKQGDLIAWSGNTGSSGGPHLHFELRNSQTEETINPQSLGIQIKDHLSPKIEGLYIYKTNHAAFSEFTPKQYFQTIGKQGNYGVNKNPVITVAGEIGFGIMAYDLQDGSSNHNGLFSTTIKLDGNTIYETTIDKFAFEDSRAVNAFIDYPSKIVSGRVIQKGFMAPNAKIKFHNPLKTNGLIELNDQAIHPVEYILKDLFGNQSILKFNIKSSTPTPIKMILPKGQIMNDQTANQFQNEEVKVNLPKGIFYDAVDFIYATLPKPSNGVSKIHRIHNKLTPLHNTYDLSIKIDSAAIGYANKAIVVNTTGGALGGTYKNGFIMAHPKVFGDFYVRIDTVPPVIRPLNVKEGVNLSMQKNIQFRISDQLSGIKSFNGYIDGEWILMEFEVRNGSLWHNFDERTGFGKHTFNLVVTDERDNIKTYSIQFYR